MLSIKDPDILLLLCCRSRKKKPPLNRTISSIDGSASDKAKFLEDDKNKKADKLIEAEKAETGKVGLILNYYFFVTVRIYPQAAKEVCSCANSHSIHS